MPQKKTYYLLTYLQSSATYFILKTFLFCKSFPLQPFFFFFRTDYMIPQTFTVTSEHIRFYFLVFFCFYTIYTVVVSARLIKLTHVGFRAHVKIASRIVLYTDWLQTQRTTSSGGAAGRGAGCQAPIATTRLTCEIFTNPMRKYSYCSG